MLICFIFDIELFLPYNIENRYCMPNMLSTVNKDGTGLLTVLEQLTVPCLLLIDILANNLPEYIVIPRAKTEHVRGNINVFTYRDIPTPG